MLLDTFNVTLVFLLFDRDCFHSTQYFKAIRLITRQSDSCVFVKHSRFASFSFLFFYLFVTLVKIMLRVLLKFAHFFSFYQKQLSCENSRSGALKKNQKKRGKFLFPDCWKMPSNETIKPSLFFFRKCLQKLERTSNWSC